MLSFLLDFFFPRHSLSGEEGEWITENELCQLHAHSIVEEAHQLRSLGLTSLDAIKAASAYQRCPLLKKVIHTFKYKRVPTLDQKLGSLIVHSNFARSIPKEAVLCPVPLHWTRKFQRGFNQSEKLARVIGEQLSIDVVHLLKRKRRTGHQAWRKRAERFDAVYDAFSALQSVVPRHVILVDDLATTGATLDACARALKDVGCKSVEGWVIARG